MQSPMADFAPWTVVLNCGGAQCARDRVYEVGGLSRLYPGRTVVGSIHRTRSSSCGCAPVIVRLRPGPMPTGPGTAKWRWSARQLLRSAAHGFTAADLVTRGESVADGMKVRPCQGFYAEWFGTAAGRNTGPNLYGHPSNSCGKFLFDDLGDRPNPSGR